MNTSKLLEKNFFQNLFSDTYEIFHGKVAPWIQLYGHADNQQECAILYTQLTLQLTIEIVVTREAGNKELLRTIINRTHTHSKKFIFTFKGKNAEMYIEASKQLKKAREISGLTLHLLHLPLTVMMEKVNTDHSIVQSILTTLNEMTQECISRIEFSSASSTLETQDSFGFMNKFKPIEQNPRGTERKSKKMSPSKTFVANENLFK